MIDSLILVFLGHLLGTFTGIIPGIHVNTVTALIVSSGLSLGINRFIPIVMAMSITHTFLNFIPATLIGVPDPSAALTVLPGHEMVLRGRGLEAIEITLRGSFLAVLVTIPVLPIYYFLIKNYESFQGYIGYLLLLISFFMVLSDSRKLRALIVFLISGYLGHLVLNVLSSPSEGSLLFPTFSGLFGISTLIISLKNRVEIPKQPLENSLLFKKKDLYRNTFFGSFGGAMVSIFPGVGSAQAAIIIQQVFGVSSSNEIRKRDFLASVSSINTSNAIFCSIALYIVGTTRNGVMVSIKSLYGNITLDTLLLMLGSVFLVAPFAFYTGRYLSKVFIKRIHKVPYRKIVIFIITFLLLITYLLTGIIGIIILLTSSLVGIIPPLIGVKRSQCMGVLLVPIMIFYLF